MTYRFAVGSYTEPAGHVPDARGAGISLLELDLETDQVRTLSVVSDLISPSYLAVDKTSNSLFAVSETTDGGKAPRSWSIDENGNLIPRIQKTETVLSGCHLTVMPDRYRLFTASYADGLITEYELRNGIVGPVIQKIRYDGTGPNTQRQEMPHAHQVLQNPAGNRIYVCDLGSDTVWLHHLDSMEKPPAVGLEVPSGYGPRHMAFHPRGDVAYILCELIPKLLVTVIDPDSGSMEIVKELDTVGKNRRKKAAPAAIKIHPSGHTVAVSNRFDDTISIFNINRSKGVALSQIDNFPCRGKTTRDMEFSPDGQILFIANQDSHDIQCRYFDGSTGLPIENWGPVISIGSPACVLMV